MPTLVVIPARYGSTRLPVKVLLNETGKYLMHHTYEQVKKCKLVDRIIIAADDERVQKAGLSFCAETLMTSKDHACGTDRIAEVARAMPGYQHIINVQADEPEIDPRAISKVILALKKNSGIDIATVAVPMEEKHLTDPNKVKVFFNRDKLALAFVRTLNQLKYFIPGIDNTQRYRHIGIYGYKRTSLLRFVQFPQAELEKQLKLEQLRAMANGFKIEIVLLKSMLGGYGIDTPADYQAFVKRYNRK